MPTSPNIVTRDTLTNQQAIPLPAGAVSYGNDVLVPQMPFSDLIQLIESADEGASFIFQKGATFDIRGSIRYKNGQKFNLNGATLRVNPGFVTTTTTPIVTGQTSNVIVVSDASGIMVGDDLSVTSGTFGGSSYDFYNHRVIAKNGNTITVDTPFMRAFANGGTVFSCGYVFDGSQRSERTNDVWVYNGTLDGNKNSIVHTYITWQNHALIRNAGDDNKFSTLKIINGFGDGAIVTGINPQFDSCQFLQINGNGIHLSDMWEDASGFNIGGATGAVISRCRFSDCNLTYGQTNHFHNDGAIGSSIGVVGSRIVDNWFDTCAAAFAGMDSTNECGLVFSGNFVTKMSTYTMDIFSSGRPHAVSISNNVFYYNPGAPLRISGGNGFETSCPGSVAITGNVFACTQLRIYDYARDVSITGNSFRGHAASVSQIAVSLAYSTLISGNSFRGAYAVSVAGACDGVLIQGNELDCNYAGISANASGSTPRVRIIGNRVALRTTAMDVLLGSEAYGELVGWHYYGVEARKYDAFSYGMKSYQVFRFVSGATGRYIEQRECLKTSQTSIAVNFSIVNYAGTGNIRLLLGGNTVATYSGNTNVSTTFSSGSSNTTFRIEADDTCTFDVRGNTYDKITCSVPLNIAADAISGSATGTVFLNNVIDHEGDYTGAKGLRLNGNNQIAMGNVVRVGATNATSLIIESGKTGCVAAENIVSKAITDSGTGTVLVFPGTNSNLVA